MFKSCGVLGLSPVAFTKQDFAAAGYRLTGVTTDCGVLGFGATPASLSDLPAEFLDCTPPGGGQKDVSYSVTAPGVCTPTRLKPVVGEACTAEPGGAAAGPHVQHQTDERGRCVPRSCDAGFVFRPSHYASPSGVKDCAKGYEHVMTAESCMQIAKDVGLHYADFASHSKLGGVMPGCFVSTAGGKPTAYYNPTLTTSAQPDDQFVLCQRKAKHECAPVGSSCLPSKKFSNYTWRQDGKCTGTCKLASGSCRVTDRCCFGECVNATDLNADGTCPGEKRREELAETSINAVETLVRAVAKY